MSTAGQGWLAEWRDSDGGRSLRFSHQAQVLPNRNAAGYLGLRTGGGVLVGVGPRRAAIRWGQGAQAIPSFHLP
jgi:hypothetical protein